MGKWELWFLNKMLSSKKKNKVKVKPYIKQQDPIYCGLLKLACVSDQTDYTADVVKQAVMTLNSLPDYINVHQRLIPLLHAKARKLAIFDQLNEQTKQLLIKGTQQGVITELAKAKQLKQILEVLIVQSIPVILLKGVAFNNLLYRSDAPRTSNDIDLLVKKEHWQQAVVAVKTIMNPIIKDKKAVFDDLYESSFVPSSKVGAALDLHMSLIHPGLFAIEQKALWRDSVVHPYFNDANVRTLSPEHALLHQAIHAFKDMNFCKYNLLDSYEIINGLKPDIALTVEIAKVWRASIPCYYLLKNCVDIMGSKIDEQLLSNIQPSRVRQYVADKLLASRFAQPMADKKPIRYRINQVSSQFVFTDGLLSTFGFQWLFLTTAMKQKMRVMD
jgi:hypothetical protein